MAAQGPDPGGTDAGHVPVMLDATIGHLAVRAGGRYIDATFGGGGHSRAILEASSPDGELLALDADPAAVTRAHRLQASFPDRMRVVQSNFAHLARIASDTGFESVDGVLFDLGLSSYQFDDRARGFSLYSDVPLDMRLDPTAGGLTAREIVNEWSPEQIADVLFQFGDERRSRRIARAIADRRATSPIETNEELAELVQSALGGRRGARVHPATKTFQAIRIAVNAELDALRAGLMSARDLLAPGGRVAVIAFHSLEDRIVKQFFQKESRDCICPPHLPVCNCDHKSTLRVVTRRTIVATDEEQRSNPRSRSARLRVAERI